MSLGRNSSSLRFWAGCLPLLGEEPPRGWVFTAATTAPGAHRAALLKEVGELPAHRKDSAVGAREPLPAQQ